MDQVTLDLRNAHIGGTIPAIASKSFAHRLLIAAALSDRPSNIICNTTSKDIEATVSCLNSLGARITKTENTFHITPIRKADGLHCLDCGESGSTLRFLLPVIAALGIDSEITMHGRLSERPLSPLYEEMVRFGAELSAQGTNPFTVSGQLKPGNYTIAGNVSSQYISGLLFALPLLKEDSIITITETLQSRPYIDITLSVIRSFNISIIEQDNCFIIPGGQVYRPTQEDLRVEGDWSNAAFFLTLGAIHQTPVTVTGLNPDSLQGDKAVISILRSFGAEITEDKDSFTVCGLNGLKAADFDASDIPDLVPILSVAAAMAEGTTVIRNIQRLRIKESDRVETILCTLKALGASGRCENDSIIIAGQNDFTGGTCDSFNDHRIAMMAAVAATRAQNPVIITQPMAVSKSYPEFYKDLRTLCN